MNKVVKSLICFLFFFVLMMNVSAKEATLYFFHGEGCPHCAEEEILLKKLEEKYKDLKVIKYEVWYNEDNKVLLQEKAKELNITVKGVPLTIIGADYITGYNSSYASRIEEMVAEAIKDDTSNANDEEQSKKDTIYELPILGKIDIKKVSLPIISIVIGLVDGFNPCAMWVLLFLISMLIGLNNRKRMWSLGITFLVTSAVVYMLIMMSWLEIIVNINTSIILKNIIAVVALIGAFINIRSYIKARKTNGCTVVSDSKRKRILEKIKKFTSEKSLILSLIGIMILAVSVNAIELACSAGLPLLFTQILSLNNVTTIGAFAYTLIYIFFFLLDDLIIFIVAMITLKVSGISTKYTKYSHLVGGILMFIIAVLLIFKPEWIMFNF